MKKKSNKNYIVTYTVVNLDKLLGIDIGTI